MSEYRHLYQTLQVDPSADPEIIDAAYRRLARKYHPDSRGPDASEEKMKELNQAYEVLSDPVSRRDYDRQMAETNSIRRKQETAEIAKRAAQEALVRSVMETLGQQHRSATSFGAITDRVAHLDGTAIITAQNGTYLGLISSDPFEADSIANSYGAYGNPYSPASIRNEYGIYGGQYGTHSPYNPHNMRPPVIVRGGQVVAYLTVNPYLKPAISPHHLLSQLGIS